MSQSHYFRKWGQWENPGYHNGVQEEKEESGKDHQKTRFIHPVMGLSQT